jgi:hypothetical protein
MSHMRRRIHSDTGQTHTATYKNRPGNSISPSSMRRRIHVSYEEEDTYAHTHTHTHLGSILSRRVSYEVCHMRRRIHVSYEEEDTRQFHIVIIAGEPVFRVHACHVSPHLHTNTQCVCVCV